MEIIKDKVFIIENFISKNTADFLVNTFSKNLIETDRAGIYTSIGSGEQEAYKLSVENKIREYDGETDVAIDILTGLCYTM